jgi:hypothetical protein
MSPEYVQPYVKAQKNDDRDAEAIAEAATRPTMRFVALKSERPLRKSRFGMALTCSARSMVCCVGAGRRPRGCSPGRRVRAGGFVSG